MEKELQLMRRGGRSRPREGDSVGKAIWNFKILNAVKMFMWRACNNHLLTKTNLLRRRVVFDSQCPICGIDEETVKHVLWNCPSARNIWGVCHEVTKRYRRGAYFSPRG